MAADRPDYDQALKQLLVRAHDGVLALVAPDLHYRQALSPELPAILRQADFVWEVSRPDGAIGLLHLELQTQADADLSERLVDYGVRLWRREHLPVRSVLILLRRTQNVPRSPLVLTFGQEEVLRYHFHVVRLWQLAPSAVLERPEPALWPLATVMAEATVETALAVAERLGRADLPAGELRDLTGRVAALAGLARPRQAVLAALRRDPMIRQILEESSVAQGWWEEGHERGRQEGREEGRQQEGRELAHLALEGRFGTREADEQAVRAHADTATLRAVVIHLASDSREQVRSRLGLA